MFTLDSNILIYYLNDVASVADRVEQWKREGAALYISTITEIEVLSLSSLSQSDLAVIHDLLNPLTIIPVDSRIARIAAQLRRTYRIRTPDSAIAATAISTQSGLATRDVKHFEHIEEINLEIV